jgi:hypothetical protein
MITDAGTNACRRECPCGSSVLIPYELIKYKHPETLPQLVFPVCEDCETRQEFLFIGDSTNEIGLKVFMQMQVKGLLK